jgi:hypothetical protein
MLIERRGGHRAAFPFVDSMLNEEFLELRGSR